jgi:hypothetical protein
MDYTRAHPISLPSPTINTLLGVQPLKQRILIITGLPDHVPADIFLLVFHNKRRCSPNHDSVARVLSSVSSLWRAIALSTCRLWVSVRLSSCIERLLTHLGRSEHLPINVDLDLDRSKHYRARCVFCRITGLAYGIWILGSKTPKLATWF